MRSLVPNSAAETEERTIKYDTTAVLNDTGAIELHGSGYQNDKAIVRYTDIQHVLSFYFHGGRSKSSK